MLKKELKMIKRVAKNIYPSFESELKCIITLVNFKKGEIYKIEGFGNAKGLNDEKLNVWFILNISNPAIKFPVKKETINNMIDNKMIEFYYNN